MLALLVRSSQCHHSFQLACQDVSVGSCLDSCSSRFSQIDRILTGAVPDMGVGGDVPFR